MVSIEQRGAEQYRKTSERQEIKRTASQGLKEAGAGFVHHKKAAAALMAAKGITLILMLMVAMLLEGLKTSPPFSQTEGILLII